MKAKKKVYVAISADLLHDGHINILKQASKLGEVIVGVLTDKIILKYKQIPNLDFETRLNIIKKNKYVSKVVIQEDLDQSVILKKLKPHYVVHGDDWKKGFQKKIRSKVIKVLKGWGGKLIEPKYTKGFSIDKFNIENMKIGTTPDIRRKKLKRLLRAKNLIRVMEAHNPISAIIVETTNVSKNNQIQEFDAIWSSSLTDSVSRGVPDDQTLDYSVRLSGVSDMFNVVTKPLIFDLDNGGHIDHIPRLIKRIETLGISAVIVEDKRGFKQNSLFANQKKSQLEKLNTFTKKIKKIKASQINDDFIMIARIESLILGLGLKDALRRAEAYSKAGADMIMIHSKSKSPNEILKFAKQFQKSNYFKPLVAVPSTYSSITEKKLEDHGFKIVIYANQLLRASFKSMSETAKKILNDQRASRADKSIASINTILNLVK